MENKLSTADEALLNDLKFNTNVEEEEVVKINNPIPVTNINIVDDDDDNEEISEESSTDSSDKHIRAEQKREAEKVENRLASQEKSILELNEIAKASKKAKKRLYVPSEPVYTIDDQLKVRREEEEDQIYYNQLVMSYKAKAKLTGRICGSTYIEVPKHDENGKVIYNPEQPGRPLMEKVPCAEVRHGNFKIVIPQKFLFKAPDNIEGDAKTRRTFLRLGIDRRLGAEIDYIITGIEEASKVATADRLAAQSITRHAALFEKNKSTGTYNINEGSLVEARVMYTTSAGVGLEVAGIDTFVKTEDIAYVQIPSVEQAYRPGDRVIVRVIKLKREITKNEEGKKQFRYGIKVSIKAATKDPRIDMMMQYKVGDKRLAFVTNVTEDGIFCRIDGEDGKIDARCGFPSKGRTPIAGDYIQIRITRIEVERVRITAEVVR